MTARPVPAWMLQRPLLLPALLLWGWQTGFLIPAIAMALALEAPRLARHRLDIAQADFNRLWSFTAVLFLAVLFYLFLARSGFASLGVLATTSSATEQRANAQQVADSALSFLRWLPFVLAPFTLAHAWSRAVTLPWSTFSMYEQNRAKRHPDAPPPDWSLRPMHPGYLFVGAVLFSSVTEISDHPDFYPPLLLAVLVLTVRPLRTRRYGPLAWGVVLALLMTVAVFANRAHQVTRQAAEALENRIMSGGTAVGQKVNKDQSHRKTAMGQVGTMKQSDEIILRIETSDRKMPGLLREAAFTRFQGVTWDTPKLEYQLTELGPPVTDAGIRSLTVARFTVDGTIPLAVPGDLRGLATDPVLGIEKTDLAALRIQGGPPLLLYTVGQSLAARGQGAGLDGRPGPADLDLATLDPVDLQSITATAEELGLVAPASASRAEAEGEPALAPPEVLAAVVEHFAEGFTYATWQKERPAGTTGLSHFLRTSHAGHCEYYASATTLLLRAGGVPARYVVGFASAEGSGDQWLARGRDSHAWCLAWIDGAWHDVDTTPGSWREQESARSSEWTRQLKDLFSNLWYDFAHWRQFGGSSRLLVLVVGMLGLAWIGWRQLRGSRWRKAAGPATATGPAHPGLDSEFFVLVAALLARDLRQPDETLPRWLARLGRSGTLPASITATAGEALALHQRLRFAPEGLTPAERERLRTLVTTAVAGLPKTGP